MYWNTRKQCWKDAPSRPIKSPLVARHVETQLLREGWGLRYQGIGWDNGGVPCHYAAHTSPYLDEVGVGDMDYPKSLPAGCDTYHYWELIPPVVPELDATNLPEGWGVEYRGMEWKSEGGVYYVYGRAGETVVEINDANISICTLTMGSPCYYYWELIPPVVPELDTTNLPELDTTNLPELDTTNLPELDTTNLPEGWTVEYRGIDWVTDEKAYYSSCVEYNKGVVRLADVNYESIIREESLGSINRHFWELIPPVVPELDTTNLPEGWGVEYRGMGWKAEGSVYYVYSWGDTVVGITDADISVRTLTLGIPCYYYWELIPPVVPELDTTNLPEGWTVECRGMGWDNGGKSCYHTFGRVYGTIPPNLTFTDCTLFIDDIPSGDCQCLFWELTPPVPATTTVMEMVGEGVTDLPIWLITSLGYTKAGVVSWDQTHGYLINEKSLDLFARDEIRWSNDRDTLYTDANEFIV